MRRKLEIKDRIIGSGKVSTAVGFVTSTAMAGAFQYYKTSGGNVGSWQPYAAAAAFAVVGALYKKKAPPPGE